MSTITIINDSDLITVGNETINTNFSNLNSDKMETSVIDTDTALAANSDSKIPSQKAVKAYIDNQGNNLAPTGAVMPFAGSSAPTGWLMADGSAVSRSTYATLFGVISTTYGSGNGSTTFNLPNLIGRIPVGVGAGTKVFTFVSRASNTITVSGASNIADNEIQTGQAVLYTAASGAMTGLTHNTTYYLIRVAYNQFTLATTRANAVAGTVIALSSDGIGTQTFTLSLTTRTLAETGGENSHSLTIAEMPAHTHSMTAMDNTPDNDYFSNGTGTTIGTHVVITGSNGSSVEHNIMPPFISLNYIIKI